MVTNVFFVRFITVDKRGQRDGSTVVLSTVPTLPFNVISDRALTNARLTGGDMTVFAVTSINGIPTAGLDYTDEEPFTARQMGLRMNVAGEPAFPQ